MVDANDRPEFVISRVFDAPRELIWKLFSEAEHLKHWWGPKGFKVFAATMDFRPGGRFHYGMKSPSGVPMWGLFRYREIAAPERMLFINSFSDENGEVCRHGGHERWPLEMMTSFTFEQLPDAKTRLTTRSHAFNASEEEQNTFADNHDSMRGGWTGTLDQLDVYLTKSR